MIMQRLQRLHFSHSLQQMKRFYTVQDIARLAKVNKTTVFRWLKAGKFGTVQRIGNEYRISPESYKKWWESSIVGKK